VLFFPETDAGPFAQLGGFNPSFAVFAPGNNATSSLASGASTSRNHAPAKVLLDNLSYVRGNHSFNFGVNYAQYNTYSFSITRVVPAITFGLDTNDPANSAMFVSTNFPSSSTTDLNNARNLYALLTGRITAITATAPIDEKTGKFAFLGPAIDRMRQRTLGFHGQDAWRFRPNLTINAGLRWELQFPFVVLNDTYTQASPDRGYTGIWGVSGVGNLFKPGTLTGSTTAFTQFPQKTYPYNTDWNNFGPSVGFAWSPNARGGFLRRLMGESGGTVIRGGYSIAFVREGSDVMDSIIGGNPSAFTATRSIALGNLTPGTLFRNPAALAPPGIPSAPAYPKTPTSAVPYAATSSSNAFLPNLKVGWVESWSVGIQRELTKDTVVEVRYVGNRGKDLWHQYDLNETNITENGFLDEYRLAQANFVANRAAGRTVCVARSATGACTSTATSYGYFGPGTGTFPLPIMTGYITGTTDFNNPARYVPVFTPGPPGLPRICTANCEFGSSTFTNNLGFNNANARAFANSLIGDPIRRNNGIAAGLARNLFVLNPDTFGGAFIVDNSGRTWYDSLQVEVRRRLSRGLLVQGSYTFSKSLSNMYGTSGSVSFQPATLRDRSLDNNISPFDLTHGLKANWIWELPFGKGQSFLGNANGLVDRLVGGWGIHGQARLQSGSTFTFGNVQLVGMTAKELQKEIKIRKVPTGATSVFFLSDDIILNTRRAFNSTPTGFGSLGAPTGRYIAPANSNGCIQTFVGQCGFANLVLHGPRLTRFDISVVKKTKISETVNFEMRAEFLNAFNNINFKIGSQTAADTSVTNFSAATFGQTSNAYQDLSTTNDVGGRMIQIVLRLNF
jgi:hypothetical protein